MTAAGNLRKFRGTGRILPSQAGGKASAPATTITMAARSPRDLLRTQPSLPESRRWQVRRRNGGSPPARHGSSLWLRLLVRRLRSRRLARSLRRQLRDLDLAKTPKPGEEPVLRVERHPVVCGPRGLPTAHNVLYHNNRDGTFTDVSEKAGILQTRRPLRPWRRRRGLRQRRLARYLCCLRQDAQSAVP